MQFYSPLVRYSRFSQCVRQSARSISVSAFPENTVDIMTGRHLFSERRRNTSGLDFKVTYVDEQSAPSGIPKASPVVLMLHGAPGSNADFNPQIEKLVENGARVIAPNFPNLPSMLKHRSPKFRNTPLNKSELIKDFLKALDIKKIDMMVVHSAGVYPGLRLFRSPEELDIRSIAMINPLGHWHTCTRPGWFYIPLGELVNYRLGYAFIKLAGMKFLPLISPVSVPNVDEPMTGLSAIRSFNMKEVIQGLKEIATKKPHLMFIYSENDRLIKKRVSYEMLDLLGVDKTAWWLHDSKGQLKREGKEGDWIKVLSFEEGSHYSMRKHPETVGEYLVGHLQSALSNFKEDVAKERVTDPTTMERSDSVGEKLTEETGKRLKQLGISSVA